MYVILEASRKKFQNRKEKKNHYEKPPNALQHFYFEICTAHTSHHLQHQFLKWYTVLVSCYFIGKWKSNKLSSNEHPEVTLLLDAQKWWANGRHTHMDHTPWQLQEMPGMTRSCPFPSGIRWVVSILTWAGMHLVFWHMNPQSMRTRIYRYTFTALPVWPRVEGHLVVNFSSFPTWKFAKLLSLVRSFYPCICVHFTYKKVSSIHCVLTFSHSAVSDSLWPNDGL